MQIVFPNPTSVQALQISFDSIKRAFLNAVSSTEATSQIVLRAPNGKTYNITVANDGTLTSTIVGTKG